MRTIARLFVFVACFSFLWILVIPFFRVAHIHLGSVTILGFTAQLTTIVAFFGAFMLARRVR